jgi:exosortase
MMPSVRESSEGQGMRSITARYGLLALCAAAVAVVAVPSVVELLVHSHPNWYYTHIPVIPAIAGIGLYLRLRRKVLSGSASGFWPGFLIAAAGAALFLFGRPAGATLNTTAFVSVSAALVFWWGAFLGLFGTAAFRNARFPLLFLVFAVPLPMPVIDATIAALVSTSTVVTRLLFLAIGVPFYQDGSVFYLPGFGLEVAAECSGIRSTLALLITAVLAGQLVLRGPTRKIILALAVFPVSVFKNAVRILVLYLLSYFVDMRIIDGGFLHRSGGFLFFGLGLVLMGLILWALREPGRDANV